MYCFATDNAVKGCFKPTKCPYLENRSTTTIMQSNPWETGSPSTKSNEITCQAAVEVVRGCNKPGYLTLSTLVCWQVGQLRTNWSTCFLRPGHAKNCCSRLIVAGIPECPPKGELWKALSNCCWMSELFPTHMRYLNQMRPSCREKWVGGVAAVASFTNSSWAWLSDLYPSTIWAHQCGIAMDMAQQIPSKWTHRERASVALLSIPFYTRCDSWDPRALKTLSAAKKCSVFDHSDEWGTSGQWRWWTLPIEDKSANGPLRSI